MLNIICLLDINSDRIFMNIMCTRWNIKTPLKHVCEWTWKYKYLVLFHLFLHCTFLNLITNLINFLGTFCWCHTDMWRQAVCSTPVRPKHMQLVPREPIQKHPLWTPSVDAAWHSTQSYGETFGLYVSWQGWFNSRWLRSTPWSCWGT